MESLTVSRATFTLPEDYLRDTPEQHLTRILDWTSTAIPVKYREGQKEHGGCLSRKRVFEEFEGEIVDLIVYHATLREHWNRLREILDELDYLASAGHVKVDIAEGIRRAVNLMDYGNEEGKH